MYIKSRSTGIARFDTLKLTKVSDRSKFEIGSGQETFDKTEFGASLRTVVIGGHLTIEGQKGRKEAKTIGKSRRCTGTEYYFYSVRVFF